MIIWILILVQLFGGLFVVECSLSIQEILALKDIYDATNGEQWNWKDVSSGPRWFSRNVSILEMNPCSESGAAWQGVRCNAPPDQCISNSTNTENGECSVIYLQLPDYNLQGTFFQDSIGDLTNLQVLNMFSNPFLSGTIPSTLGSTKLFYLDFQGCGISGSIPSSVGEISDLWQFRFRDNSLTGSLPVELTKPVGLQVLELRGNYLTSTLPTEYSSMVGLQKFDVKFNLLTGTIPEEYISMISLTNFELYQNDMTGTIPTMIGSLTNMQVLDFDFNDFEGTIPSQIGGLTRLQYLYFYGNKQLTGSIPRSFGNLTNLLELDLGAIDLVDTIPSELGRLVNLETFYLDDNLHLVGSIPVELGNLAHIQILWLHNNHLSSSIPAELGNLSTVKSMTFHRNFLTGTVPTEFSQLTSLSLLALHSNQLTGSPFSAVLPLVSLNTLWLDNNKFTGSFPESIQRLSLLTHLRLQYNLFSKEIPSSLGSCTNLELLELEHNYFSGSLPVSLGELKNIQVLKLAENRFSGEIPSLGNMTLMKDFVLRSNRFEGSVSFGVGKFQLLEFFDISGNIFTGKLPTELGELQYLTQMYVQGNVFTGPLNMVFSQQPSNMSLINIDLSDNKFSGSVPYSVFQIPSVAVVALSLNCFQGSLPVGICDAKELQGASMDGLGAAHGCAHSYSMPFTNIALFNKLEGSIPNCVFSMPNLKFLHMSGNGLTGTLAQIPDSSKLEYIHIAHNQITSTIPLSYQEHYFTDLDLSYNKITGEYKQPLFVNNATSAITLEINRLSGTLDLTLEDAPDLNILRDNIYSCDHLPRNDPNYDRYTCGSTTLDDAYILLMGVAGLVLFFVTGIVVMHMYSLCYRKHNAQATCTEVNNNSDVELDIDQKSLVRQVYVLIVNTNFYLQCGEHFMNSRDEAVRDIVTYCEEIKTFSMYVLLLSVICVVAIAPILVLKSLDQSGNSNNEYVTHSHVYSWNNSVAFVTGELPAGLLLLAWFVSCSSFIAFTILTLKKFSGQFLTRQRSHESIVLRFARRFSHGTSGIHKATINAHRYIRKSVGGVFSGNKENEERNSLASATSSTELSSPVTQKKKDKLSTKMRRHVVTTSIGLMIFNTAVVSLVNGLYISYSSKVSTSTEVMLQFALGLFNVLYVICFVPALTLGFAKHSDAINVRLWLLLTNSLVIPCIVTAVTSPSCVQGIFVEPDEMTATYSYTPNCAITHYSHTGEPVCTDTSAVIVDVAPLVPPFTYNYQCTSVLLTAYIPVFIYSYSIQVAAPFIFLFTLSFLKYQSFPKVLRKMIPGVLFPDNWSKDSTKNGFRSDMLQIAASKRLYNIKTVTSTMIHNVIVLLTFGLCSPVLACLIGAATYLIAATWRVLIARFVHCRLSKFSSKSSHQLDNAMLSMARLSREGNGLIRLCLWPYVFVSAFFFLCLSWDMAGDRVGWRGGIWAPLVSLSALGVMYVAVYFCAWRTSPTSSNDEAQNGNNCDINKCRGRINDLSGGTDQQETGTDEEAAVGGLLSSNIARNHFSNDFSDDAAQYDADAKVEDMNQCGFIQKEISHMEVELMRFQVGNPMLMECSNSDRSQA